MKEDICWITTNFSVSALTLRQICLEHSRKSKGTSLTGASIGLKGKVLRLNYVNQAADMNGDWSDPQPLLFGYWPIIMSCKREMMWDGLK